MGEPTREPPIEGFCDARFFRVREAFVENFTRHGERGGAVSIARNGKTVVDLWGGFADVARAKPWARDTIVNIFSVGKALNAIAAKRVFARLSKHHVICHGRP